MEEQFWFLKKCELFEHLSGDEIAKVEGASRSRQFERGSLIYLPDEQSNSVMLLISGRVKIYHLTPEGKQTLLAFIDAGELFGELAIFDSGKREEFAEAMDPCHVIAIPGPVMQQLMEQHGRLSLGITKLLGFRRQRIERRLKSLLFRSNRERLIHLLVELLEKYGFSTIHGCRIDLKLSHQDMANLIGSTRETVTVVLGELQQEGHVNIIKRKIYVPRPAELAESIGLSATNLPMQAFAPPPAPP